MDSELPASDDVALHNSQSTENATILDAELKNRVVLGPAEGRLNNHANDHGGHKNGSRGMARLAVPLKKALLCPPRCISQKHHATRNTQALKPPTLT